MVQGVDVSYFHDPIYSSIPILGRQELFVFCAFFVLGEEKRGKPFAFYKNVNHLRRQVLDIIIIV